MEVERRDGETGAARPPTIMTVAGSDSGGGAGIQADLKTITVLGGYGVTVLTALTAQNSLGVQGVHQVPPPFVTAQLDSVIEDFRPAAAKTGMLSSAEIIAAVAERLSDSGISRLVVDPVMISTTGHRLIDEGATAALVKALFPLALVITPNLHEASALLGREVSTESQMEAAARELLQMGPATVLLKGGHLAGPASDYFCDADGGEFLEAPRVPTPHTHGSGCVLSAAVATFLGQGRELKESVRKAKKFITAAIGGAYAVGKGKGPVNPAAARHVGGGQGA